MSDLISQKEDRLRKEFGIIPEFKAGVNGGDIKVAEVGDIKREIAYHGDVINTAVRIHEQMLLMLSSYTFLYAKKYSYGTVNKIERNLI